MHRILSHGVLPALLLVSAATSQTKFTLTIDNIMKGSALVGTEPTQVRWAGDSAKIYFQWKEAKDPVGAPLDTWAVNRDGSGLRRLSREEEHLAPPPQGDTNRDQTMTVYSQNGDIVLFESANNRRRQITKTADAENNPRFTQDGHRITFTRGTNLYLLSLDSGEVEQLTDIRPAGAAAVPAPAAGGGGRGGRGGGNAAAAAANGERPKGTDAQEFYRKDQRELFEVIRDRARNREDTEARQKQLNPRKPWTLAARQTVQQMQLSPDGKYVLALVNEPPANGAKPSDVPEWLTESTFMEPISGRPRVGDALNQRHLVVVDVVTGETKTVDHGETGFKAAEMVDGVSCAAGFGGGGGGQAVHFSDDGSKSIFASRTLDNKHCWVFSLDLATAKAKPIVEEKDSAWLGGPGGGMGWLADNQSIWFTSERDGSNHLYTVGAEGGTPKQLTKGKFEIDNVTVSRDKATFYMTTSEGSPYERHFWSMKTDGSAKTRLTKAVGSHAITISPDEKLLADIYSITAKPPELYIQPNRAMADEIRVTTSPAPEFSTYPWIDPPIVEITARDGVKVPGHLYKPKNFPPGGPAVIFVHGAGYAQNIHKWWAGGYYHEYLFHHFLMEHGYMVLDIDYRGSKGYGRDWRTAIYRHMGGQDLDDQVDAAKWLVSTQGAGAKRLGVYGGSYGGFITLMAMFTQPDVFAAGAALRPVTDWAYYNQNYSGNILNQPQVDSEAYKKSSPIYYADGLKGALLICHGMVDTNVQFIDTVRLVQRLIELRKENWDLAVFPVEDHGFREPTSWADEYKRIFRLYETNLKKTT
jgi:dipeptidyl aminopeptidase/acylaminoacyl peptidase